jgi:hypothetical protein
VAVGASDPGVDSDVAASTGIVAVRDSKTPSGPALSVPADAFAAFVQGVERGEFGDV